MELISWLRNRMLPVLERSRPEMVCRVVVLPAPLAPMRGDDLPFVDVEGDVLDGVDGA